MRQARRLGVLAAAVAVQAAVLEAPPVRFARVPPGLVREGDIVFRRGASLVSRMVLAADGEGPYSHAGIVQMRDGVPWVIHASADEPDLPHDGVRAEPLARYLAPGRATEAAVYRPSPEYSSAGPEAVRRAAEYLRAGLPFDLEFDLATPGALYCTELVWRAYRESGVDLAAGRFRRLHLPFRAGDFLLPSDLARSPALQRVYVAHSTSGEDP